MHIDGRSLARAAHQLNTALRHVDAAQRIDAPHLIGRARVTGAVQAALGNAQEWTESAARELQQFGSAAADARIAVDRLATEIDAIRFQRDVLGARNGEAFRATVHGARHSATWLDTLRAGTHALEQGTAHSWFAGSLGGSADAAGLVAARALARDARVDRLGAATAGFLRRLDPSDERSIELVRLAVASGGAAASAALLDDLVRTAPDGVDLNMLRGALRGLDDGVGDGARRMPTWLDDHSLGSRALDDIELQQLELLRRLDEPSALAGQVRELVARPFTELRNDDIARIAAMLELPAHARPALPDSTVDGVTLAQALRTGADPEPNVHHMWVAGLTTDTAAEAAAAQLLATGADTSETARRFGALAAAHPGVLGRHGDDAWHSTTVQALHTARGDARNELAEVRLRIERTRLMDDPNVTKETLTAELDAMLAKPDDDITIDELRRLAVYDELPETLRPELPAEATPLARRQLHADSRLLSVDSDARAQFSNVRVFRAATRLNDDLATTRETLSADLERILAKPDDQVTIADLFRVTLMESEKLATTKRVELPPKSGPFTRAELLGHGWLPSNDMDARREFFSLRQWLARAKLLDDPSVTRETVTEEIARLALKPDDEITAADLHRLAVLDQLPARLRPNLPEPATSFDRGEIAMGGWLPSADSDSHTEFTSLRRWAMLETETGRSVARRRVAAGEPLDPLTLESLAVGGEETLHSAGLSSDELLRHSLHTLRTTAPTDLDGINSNLELSKRLLAVIAGGEEARQLATGATELMDLNIRRIAGKVSGGFGTNPDHAEIGRAIEQAELVLALRTRAPRPMAAGSDSAAGSALLTW